MLPSLIKQVRASNYRNLSRPILNTLSATEIDDARHTRKTRPETAWRMWKEGKGVTDLLLG